MPNTSKLPDVLTEAEQKCLLSQPKPRYPTGQRNYSLLRTMLDTGFRSFEAVSLKLEHVNLMSGKLMVKEDKGVKDRNLWLDADNIDLICDWKERQVEEVAPDCKYIFTTLEGSPIKPRYLREMVSRYAKKAGIAKRVSLHTLRHCFVKDLYRETKKIRLVQNVLDYSELL